jgi:transcription-repair coupling factor (superfamily II helicase)
MITLFLNEISDALKGSGAHKTLLKAFTDRKFPFDVEGPRGFFLAFLISELYRYSKGSFLVVVPTEKEAEDLSADISRFDIRVDRFPAWGTISYSGVKPQGNVAGRRMRILTQLAGEEKVLTVTHTRALVAAVPPKSFLEGKVIDLKIGDEIDPAALREKLAAYGYLRVPKVTVIGEFALRGEVLDLFPPGQDEAVRIVFEWEKIERIAFFDPLTQATTKTVERTEIYPMSEILWTPERLAALSTRYESLKGMDQQKGELLEALRETGECPDGELQFPFSFDDDVSVMDYLDDQDTVFLVDSERLGIVENAIRKEYKELHMNARRERRLVPKPESVLVGVDESVSRRNRVVTFPAIRESREQHQGRPRISFPFSGPRSFFGNISYLKEELGNLEESGYSIHVFAESEAQSTRIEHLLKDFQARVYSESISEGFTLPDVKIVAIRESEIFGRRQRIPAGVKRAKSKAIDTFVDLSPGDHVVHVNYGIGRFKGIERIKAAGTERDYIQLEYAGDETIFIPIEQVNLVQRYIGQEGRPPRLDKIGGQSWERRKSKVAKSVEDLADMLLKLYAQRKRARGYAFETDTDWQVEFEAAFPYEETEDQISCIEDVKADMESDKPMDRLVCGDVGYGKTEIAMRAAFKAIVGGRQVAFLAPTTILAEQHFENFTERFEHYPVKIAMISRFVPRAEQKKVLKRLEAGDLDLLIGTHRLLQKDVKFKNLGLLIIDEEQRFGVKDKERLKELKASIDCLTLSATPIPRTLHMSLLKIRDMSLLTTAPHNRRPIETYIREFDEEAVADAVRREIARGGQVFYLHNRVETLNQVTLFLHALLPEVLVETAHGQLSSRDLEDIMHRFIHNDFHVLVATTIIENGIDIPNANTIIIDRADMYGVSQLYQLRGRVGRSDRTAYAYLMYPVERALSEIAMKRLQIISDYTELGSGFKIALKDLEIRGAGNLLGRQQHGEILSVGFDMYLRLLDEAIARLSDEEKADVSETYLELDYSGYIPDTYIDDTVEKLEVYKKITSIQTDEELESVMSELHDRFGPMPEELMSLLAIAEIRILCGKLRISALKERRGTVEIEFGKVSEVSVDKVLRLIKDSGGAVTLDPKRPNVLLMQSGTIGLKEKSEYLRERLQTLA